MIADICPNCGSYDIDQLDSGWICHVCAETFDEPTIKSDDPADHNNEPENSPKGENR